MKTLIFDLDETLIHCLDEHDLKTGVANGLAARMGKGPNQPFDAVVSIKYNKNEMLNASIYIRPGAVECLIKLKQYYEIVVFTASHACYANKMIDLLDPHNEIFSYRLFRDHCFKTSDGVYIKDLRILANRHLKDVILVDNAAYSFGLQQQNGVPILPFYNDKSDRQLFELVDFLIPIHNCTDVRPHLSKSFEFNLISRYAHRPDLLKEMLLQAIESK